MSHRTLVDSSVEAFSRAAGARARHLAEREPSRLTRGMLSTLPILVAGSMTVGMAFTSTAEAAPGSRPTKSKNTIDLREAVRQALGEQSQALAEQSPAHGGAVGAAEAAIRPAAAPATYRVVSGDTVSGIAAKFGLSTAKVLSLNGLGWSSLIFPGQVLKLTSGAAVAPPAPTPPAGTSTYTIVKGDTISAIAARHGVGVQAVLTANGLSWSSLIFPGQRITIPRAAAPTTPAPSPAPEVSVPESSVPAPAPAPAPAPPAAPARYVIKSGDTISAVAARFGVSVQSVLTANNLGWSTIIYPGQSIVIPGAVTAPAGTESTTPMSPAMQENAQIIVDVGRSLGVPEYGLVIALAAAMQESSLRNIEWGDRDSVGLFQQRPSAGWGTVAQIMDREHASRLFFGGPSNPNKGLTRGLLDIPGWQSMTVTQAAQAVQRSAYPDAYAKWEASARMWLTQLR